MHALNLLGADATATGMLSPRIGFYPMMFTDATVAYIQMYYYPPYSYLNPYFSHSINLSTPLLTLINSAMI
jgi:hypothetical protein